MLSNSKKYGTRKTDKTIILKLNPGKTEPCDACPDVKSKQKNFPRKVNTNQKYIRRKVFTLELRI